MNQFRASKFGLLPPVIKNLLILNILLFVGTYALESSMGIDLTQYLALFYPKSEYFYPFQFVTHMFMHGSLSHLFFNMFALWMFGNTLENVWGPKKFLIYYFVTGLGAAALHTFINYLSISGMMHDAIAFQNTPDPELFMQFVKDHLSNPSRELIDFMTGWADNPDNSYMTAEAQSIVTKITELKSNIPTVGASGAVFGVLLAFGMMFPNAMLYVYFAIPIRAKYFVIIYGAIELIGGVMQQPGDNVAHFAHLGGMIFGFILIKLWKKNNFNRIN